MRRLLTDNYRKIFIAICGIWLAAVVVMFFCAAGEKKEYVCPLEQTVTDAGAPVVLSEQIELPVGIYSVQVYYHTAADMQYRVYIADESLAPPRLMQNEERLGAANTAQDFRVWLFGRPQNLQLCVAGAAEQGIFFEEFRIINTRQIWYCAIFCVSVLCVILLAGVFCAAGFHADKISKSDLAVGGLIVFLSILLSGSFLSGSLNNMGDTVYHLERFDGVAQSLKNGVFPMRLEPNFPFGYGYADGVMYGSMLLYIPAALWLIGFPVVYSYNIFIVMLNFAVVIVAFYCFNKIFADKYIGLMCSALYSFSLYRLLVLYGRGCLGEVCVQVFMPLLLYGYYRLFTEDVGDKRFRSVWLFLLVGYTGIVQSHTLSTELALFWTVLVCLLNIRRILCRERIRELVKGAVSCLLCNAWYLLPFLDYYFTEDLLVKHTGDRLIQFEGMTWDLVFVHFFDGALTREDYSNVRGVGPGLIPLLALLLFFGIAICSYVRAEKSSLLDFVSVSAVFAVLSIVFSLRMFPWDFVQQLNPLTRALVSSLEFPTRFLNWNALFLVPVFGYCLWFAKNRCKGSRMPYLIGVAAVVLAVGTSSVYYICRASLDYGKVKIYDNNQIIGYMSSADYAIYGTDSTRVVSYGMPRASESVLLSGYQKGDLAADFTCVNEARTEGYVEVPLFRYKGYHAYAGSGGELSCEYGENNVIRVVIPAGFSDAVSVRFVSPVLWRIGEVISLLAWIAVIVAGWRHPLRRIRKEGAEQLQ